ncbi:hypothetical protein EDC04DRAFT_2959313 [Pisolithus marmoratus]|nr:hypothetical protein EDC04DRAFT_2959313 [Pisolithus marmoratus]
MSASHVSQSSQPITTKGIGRHFSSPPKARNKKKTLVTVSVPVHAFKHQKLLDELASLLAPPPSESGLHIHSDVTSPIHHPMEPPELIEPEEIMVDSEEVSPANVTVKCTSIKVTNLLCLFFDCDCDCSTLPQTLISHGLFPTAPSQPRMAVSVELLSFYHALFKWFCNAINALTAALSTYYGSQATQWYAILQVEVEKQVDSILQCCQHLVKPPAVVSHSHHPPSLSLLPATKQEPLSHTCADILIQQCLACFSSVLFGTSLDKGSDIDPSYFLPKAQVDTIGCYIAQACQHPSKRTKSIVPDEAIDQCEASYKATDGQKQKASMDGFDNTGLMVLIYTPGEQQKYSVTLIDHLFSLLPPQANVVVLYDMGCVLAHSLCQFDIFDQAIMSCLCFATTAMHAYGHEWACQLIYNPCLITGLGLSDGEGTEHLWSHFIKLIGIECVSSKGVHEQGSATQEVLDNGGVSIAELQEQWANQQAAQLSIRACIKSLTLLSLQAELDTTTKVIQVAWATIELGNVSPGILDALASMERSHTRLITKAEALYSSLNVHEQFPELTNISLNFWAIGSFFEWDKLDWAVGSKDKPLGTKLHQQMCKAIAKHQPMLMAAICKYNTYCEQLSQLYDPSWAIPLPSSLPTKLTPHWVEDADMQDGIRALLKREHCLEEQCCLSLESKNGNYHLILRQRLEAILELQERWLTVLCSPSCYSHQAQVSVQLTNAITGASLPPLSWLLPVVVDDHTNSAEDEDMWGVTDLLGPDLPDLSLEPEQITLLDVLGVGHLDDQDDLELEAKTLSQVSFKWGIPTFCPTMASCAILSTHDLPHIRFNTEDDILWCNLSWMQFWEKPIWILPIHRSLPVGHWVLCTIKFHSWQLFLFDSLAQQKPWRNDIKDIMWLICHLSSMVTWRLGTARQDQGDWTAYPVLLEPSQTNSHDCGVWVLAQMAAILRGYEVTGIREHDINHF